MAVTGNEGCDHPVCARSVEVLGAGGPAGARDDEQVGIDRASRQGYVDVGGVGVDGTDKTAGTFDACAAEDRILREVGHQVQDAVGARSSSSSTLLSRIRTHARPRGRRVRTRRR